MTFAFCRPKALYMLKAEKNGFVSASVGISLIYYYLPPLQALACSEKTLCRRQHYDKKIEEIKMSTLAISASMIG